MKTTAEQIAQAFHESYERLAPAHSYETRKASAMPWADVPEKNKRLMVAVANELLTTGKIAAGPAGYVVCVSCEHAIKKSAAEDEGWKFVTMHDGEPAWQCDECQADAGEQEASDARAM